MLYVMVGLVCSSAGCQWVQASDEQFLTEQICQYRADCLKPLSAGYFDIKCKPAAPAAQS